MDDIRQATLDDLSRITEIEIFNYRLNFYPIFKDDDFYFRELQVVSLIEQYKAELDQIWVYDDGAVKGFIRIEGQQVKKLFVEPVLQGNAIGGRLLDFLPFGNTMSVFCGHWRKTSKRSGFMSGMGFVRPANAYAKMVPPNIWCDWSDRKKEM